MGLPPSGRGRPRGSATRGRSTRGRKRKSAALVTPRRVRTLAVIRRRHLGGIERLRDQAAHVGERFRRPPPPLRLLEQARIVHGDRRLGGEEHHQLALLRGEGRALPEEDGEHAEDAVARDERMPAYPWRPAFPAAPYRPSAAPAWTSSMKAGSRSGTTAPATPRLYGTSRMPPGSQGAASERKCGPTRRSAAAGSSTSTPAAVAPNSVIAARATASNTSAPPVAAGDDAGHPGQHGQVLGPRRRPLVERRLVHRERGAVGKRGQEAECRRARKVWPGGSPRKRPPIG